MNRKPLMSKTQTICLIILWVLFALLAIIMVKEIRDKNKILKEKEFKEIALESEEVNNAFKGWDLNFGLGVDSLVTKLYSENFKVQDMTEAEKVFITLRKETEIPDCDSKDSLKLNLDKLNELLKKNFIDEDLDNDSLNNIIGLDGLGSIYNLTVKENTLSLRNNCLKEKPNMQIIIKKDKAYKNNEYLKIDLKMALRKEDKDGENIVFDYYKDIKATNKIVRLYKVDVDKINWEDFATYEFIFKISNNNFYLEEVSKLT